MNVPIVDKPSSDPTDEAVGTFYSCAVCQSISPGHVCIISPEHPGQCGVYTWQSCRAGHTANPIGPYQPVAKGKTLDRRRGQWQGVNDCVSKASGGKIRRVNLYSLVNNPVTTCNQCEAIAAVLPKCNGFMVVSRDYHGLTPAGMDFQELRRYIGYGTSTPGFVGHSKKAIAWRKFLAADGGILRLVWMPSKLKKEIRDGPRQRAAELGTPDLLDCIADETVGLTEEAILPFLRGKRHPALDMGPLL